MQRPAQAHSGRAVTTKALEIVRHRAARPASRLAPVLGRWFCLDGTNGPGQMLSKQLLSGCLRS